MSNKIIGYSIIGAGCLIALAILATNGSFSFDSLSGENRKVKQAIEKVLLDPYSAKFGDIAKTELGYCAEVNAKNAFGAYTGASVYFVSNLSLVLSESNKSFVATAKEVPAKLVADLCSGKNTFETMEFIQSM